MTLRRTALSVACLVSAGWLLAACGTETKVVPVAPQPGTASGGTAASGSNGNTGNTGTSGSSGNSGGSSGNSNSGRNSGNSGNSGSGSSSGGSGSSSGNSGSGGSSGNSNSGSSNSGSSNSGSSNSGSSNSGSSSSNSGSSNSGSSSGNSGSGSGTAIAGIEAIEVTASGLNVRKGPGTSHGVIAVSHSGETYAAFETSGSWKRIWFDGGPGWVHSGYTRASQKPVQLVTAASLNVRTGPGTRYSRVGQIPRDSLRVVDSRQGSWAKVAFNGRWAWVHSRYLADPGATTLADTTAAASQASGGGASASTGGSGTPTGQNPLGLPQSSRGFLQLPASAPGTFSYAPVNRRWGRDYFVYGILRVGEDIAAAGRPRMGTGDLGYENGGRISGHASHQKGVDVDVRPGRTSGESRVTIFQSAYSLSETQFRIDRFYQYTPVTMIFFNDSNARGVRPWPNHDNHLHVRVTER